MRALVRTALFAAVAAVATAMAPMIPAQADPSPPAGWDYAMFPSVMADETFFMHKHVNGHPGNWHQLQVWVEQDDDGVGGGVTDYRCAKGEDPTGGTCTQLAGYEFAGEPGLTVKWSPRMRNVTVKGTVLMDEWVNGGPSIEGKVNVRLHASGKRARTVTLGAPTDTDPTEYKTIDIQRGGKITARGRIAYVKATPTKVTHTVPLRVYWILSRPAPLG